MNKSAYRNSIVISSIAGFSLIVLSLFTGKKELFLLLNHNLGSTADLFFTYITYLGDGLIFVPLVLFYLFKKNKEAWISSLLIILISTLLVHLNKQILFSNINRPYFEIIDKNLIHTVAGVELHLFNSFPSGHTTTAFCVYLIIAQFTKWKAWWVIGFILAALVGYSRIYLAQHFPMDVGAGMLMAVVSSLAAKKFVGYLVKQ